MSIRCVRSESKQLSSVNRTLTDRQTDKQTGQDRDRRQKTDATTARSGVKGETKRAGVKLAGAVVHLERFALVGCIKTTPCVARYI